jgi:hypothetical protein
VYRAAHEAIDTRVATLNAESSGKYQWRPDRMPRLAEYVCDFARAGERALGFNSVEGQIRGSQAAYRELGANPPEKSIRASRMVMFRIYYLGGAEYQAARRHLGISELNWTDWAEEIRRDMGRELTRTGVFPPSQYFRERAAKAS